MIQYLSPSLNQKQENVKEEDQLTVGLKWWF